MLGKCNNVHVPRDELDVRMSMCRCMCCDVYSRCCVLTRDCPSRGCLVRTHACSSTWLSWHGAEPCAAHVRITCGGGLSCLCAVLALCRRVCCVPVSLDVVVPTSSLRLLVKVVMWWCSPSSVMPMLHGCSHLAYVRSHPTSASLLIHRHTLYIQQHFATHNTSDHTHTNTTSTTQEQHTNSRITRTTSTSTWMQTSIWTQTSTRTLPLPSSLPLPPSSPVPALSLCPPCFLRHLRCLTLALPLLASSLSPHYVPPRSVVSPRCILFL